MLRSPQDSATDLLKDLDRWVFGALLAQRAAWPVGDPERLNALVQRYRLAILYAVLKAAGPDFNGLLEALRTQRPLAEEEQAPYGEDLRRWETVLAGRFLDALERLQPLGGSEAPLTRFAHGQYFKYSRRICTLLGIEPVLPCLLAPSAPQGL